LRTDDLDSTKLRASLERVVDLAARHVAVPSAPVNIIGDHADVPRVSRRGDRVGGHGPDTYLNNA